MVDLKDEERSLVFDAHEKLRKAFTLWKRDRSEPALATLEQAIIGLQRIDSQLLANMARALSRRADGVPERYWWQKD